MNLRFETLNENLVKNMEKDIAESELSAALESANVAVRDRVNKNDVTQINCEAKETGKELIIKNANDEKIAAIKIDEVSINNSNKSLVSEKNELIQEKETNKIEKFINKIESIGVVGKVIGSVGRIGGTLIDSLAKKFLKDKYKIKYSTYNNGKKAVMAAVKKDGKTFLKKGMDVMLGLFKNIPSTTKMVFRNVKNKIVEEVFSLGKFLIAK